MNKDKFISVIETTTDNNAKISKEMKVYCDIGKTPSVGNFVEAILNELGIEVEINNFITMTFVPVDRFSTEINSIRIVRTYRDVSFEHKKKLT